MTQFQEHAPSQQELNSSTLRDTIKERLLRFSCMNLDNPSTEEVLRLLEELHENVLRPILRNGYTLRSLKLNEGDRYLIIQQLNRVNELFTSHYAKLEELTERQERHYRTIQQFLDRIIATNTNGFLRQY